MHNLISYIIATPLLGAVLLLLLPSTEKLLQRYIAACTTLLTFLLTCIVLWKFDRHNAGMQFLESHPWIESLKISYLVGIDGISVYLIPLTTLMFLLGVISSWGVDRGTKGFFSLFLILESMILGTFVAQDLFLFFAFWEASILPIYFMLGVWGHENRVYAATKFFLFQLTGSVFMMLAMLAIYYGYEPHTFSIIDLATNAKIFSDKTIIFMGHEFPFTKTLFLMFLVGFAVRIPVFPLHGWFTEAQAQAPVAVAVVLASVFIKTGAYGLLRVNFALFPSAAIWMSFALALLGVINVIYGALCAYGQSDIRKLIAYTCVSHMGFVLLGLGIFSITSFQGALLQMIAHGIYTTLLVFLVGALGDRAGYYNIYSHDSAKTFGGLVTRIPVLSGFFTVGMFAAIGLPGLVGFPAHALVFLGTFPAHRMLTVVGLVGTVLTAGYFLWMYRQVFLGSTSQQTLSFADLTFRERLFLTPLVLICVLAGIYPTPFMDFSTATLTQILGTLQ